MMHSNIRTLITGLSRHSGVSLKLLATYMCHNYVNLPDYFLVHEQSHTEFCEGR
jgi:hypothetical protein